MLSVIIPTRNRADYLAATLNSIVGQTLAPSRFEVLVVDNGSTDHTVDVVEAFKPRLPNLRRVFEPRPGLHNGRHCGLHAAEGDILVYADDDIDALNTWLEAIEEPFRDSNVAMAGGNLIPMFLSEPPRWLVQLWNRRDSRGYRAFGALSILEAPLENGEVSPGYIWGANFAVRKSVLIAAGGFHPDGMPKDLIRFRGDGETHVSRYVAASGLKCAFRAAASVHHKIPAARMTFDYMHQRGFMQGISDSYTALRQSTQTATPKPPIPLHYRVIQRLVREAKAWNSGAEMRIALRHLAQGASEGRAFHQNAYKNDEELRTWVHKENYLWDNN